MSLPLRTVFVFRNIANFCYVLTHPVFLDARVCRAFRVVRPLVTCYLTDVPPAFWGTVFTGGT